MKIQKFDNELLNCKVGTFINNDSDIYFRGKDIATALGYKDTDQAIRTHVDDDDKCRLEELDPVFFKGHAFNEKNLFI